MVIPQPNKQTLSNGAFGLTATTETSATTVYWEKVEVPICKRISGVHTEKAHPTHEVVDGLPIDGETGRVVGHQTLALRSTDFPPRERQLGGSHSRNKFVPLPQRLVLPLLQNLHSRHSETFISMYTFEGDGMYTPAV